jgi:arsenical pump membrane protein
VISVDQASLALRSLASTVAIVAGLFLLAELCVAFGVFDRAGAIVAARSGGQPVRLLAGTFALASAVTFVLGLDATVVLLTPVILRVAARKPYLYATGHLANSASLLLPISNLTNLLALHVGHIGFSRFALLMALPTAVVIAVEWVVLRRVFAGELSEPVSPRPRGSREARRTLGPARLVRAAQPDFLVFVFALGVIVRAAGHHGLSSAAHFVLPLGSSLPDLLAVAGVSAVLANAVNNLPATLILVPITAAAGTGPLLAMLIGVGIGPNLTPAGSLATLLWRRVLAADGIHPPLREFVTVGALSALPGMALATAALWMELHL